MNNKEEQQLIEEFKKEKEEWQFRADYEPLIVRFWLNKIKERDKELVKKFRKKMETEDGHLLIDFKEILKLLK